MSKRYVLAAGIGTLACAVSFGAGSANADNVADAIQTCAACHGEDGIPADKTFPIVHGQNRAYILNQLHDFKSGRRKNEIMAGIVAELTNSDMQALARHFAKQQWPANASEPQPADAKKAGAALLEQLNCGGCHHDKYTGDTQRPRLAGQNAEYLLKTLTEFRDKTRGNFITMSAILNGLTDEELKSMSDYLASLPPPVTAAAK